LDRKIIYAALVAAMILITMTTPLNQLTLTAHQVQPAATGNPTTPPPPIEWNKTYGEGDWSVAYSVQQTSDGGYVIGGDTSTGGIFYFYLVKVDADGNLQWDRKYGRGWIDEGQSAQQTSDGGYIIGGYSIPPPGSNQSTENIDILLVKTDANGNMEWNKTYSGPGDDFWTSLQQTSDGGFIIASTMVQHNIGTESWLVKTDAVGGLQWNKTYGSGEVHSVKQTSDGGYILTGYIDGFQLVKTYANGTEQWEKTYPWAGSNNTANSVCQTSDGGYIIAGTTSNEFDSDFLLIKTDANGNEQWNKTYGGPSYEHAYSVQQTSDGGYIVGGDSYSMVPGFYWEALWLVKTDANGNMMWNMTCSSETSEYCANSVEQTSDGGYIAAGDVQNSGFRFYLVKIGPHSIETPETLVSSIILAGGIVAVVGAAFVAIVLMKKKRAQTRDYMRT
jgi:hypothetical protein